METLFLEIPEDHFPPPAGGEQDGSDLDPFDISYILGLTETAGKQENSEKYIIFKLDEETLGVSLKNVLEICRALPVTSLPNVPDWLAGIANLRGSLLAVADLQTGDDKASSLSKSKIIVLSDSQKRASIGLLVDQIVEITFLPPDDFSPFRPARAPGVRSFVSGKAPYKNSSLLVFDTEKFFSSAEFNLQEH